MRSIRRSGSAAPHSNWSPTVNAARYSPPIGSLRRRPTGTDSVPVHLTTEEFLQAVRRAVAPGGVVVGNLWRRSHNRLYDSMVRTYQEVFDELFILEVFGDVNNILLALPRKQRFSRSELALLARKVSAAGQFRFDMGDLVEAAFFHAEEKNQEGRVLRDSDLGQQK